MNRRVISRSAANVVGALALNFWSAQFAIAKQVGEALSDMGDIQDTDPNGFKLMVFCIGFIVVLGATLIGVTAVYFMKSKNKAK